jgi:hypothetical protein
MQKALMQMNLQLQHAVFDITGVTGMRIRAIVAGERSPEVLALHPDVRCAASEATLRAALTGRYRPEHVFALQQALELYNVHQEKIAACDTQIETTLRSLAAELRRGRDNCPFSGAFQGQCALRQTPGSPYTYGPR